MAWDYNEEQKAEIVELRGKGERVEDIDWSKPMLADEKDLKEMSETFTPVLGRASVDEMLQAFKDFKTLMSQEDFDRMFDGQRLFREIMERFEDKPDVTEAVLFDRYGDGAPLSKEAQVKWPGLEPLDLKLKILRENGAGDLVLEFDRLFGRGDPYWGKPMMEEL